MTGLDTASQPDTHSQVGELVRYVRAHSPFYRRLYAAVPDHAKLTDLPVVPHSEYWQANTVQDNALLTGAHNDGVVFKSGGTTAAPKVSFYTRDEWREMSTTFATGLPAAGVVDGDRVANLFYAGELYSSFVFTLNTLQQAPVDTVQLAVGGAASADFVLSAVRDFSATVLAGLPTSLCQLAHHVRESVGSLPDVRLLLFSGEAFYGDQRRLISSAFPNARLRSLGYASVDGGIVGSPVADSDDTRLHRVFPGRVLEILCPETGAPVTKPGRAGRIVLTDLRRRLQPVVRYPTGDLAEWVDSEQGAFRLLGRSDEGARVGPVTVYLDDLRGVVEQACAGRLVTGVQVVLRRHAGKDELVLRVAGELGDREVFAERVRSGVDTIRPMFAHHVQRGLVHPLRVEDVEVADLAVNARSGKLVRLVDERAD
ncbi:phenylacetate--CoA ligase family protein [Allosaccharopolyspora coralli]|uniref:Phenylacetate--CoA ligase family protein n=1 Tax=Allosaccharopolyspora coralli TaxID=2665642 RepID=A0A5Q3Q9S9_9PSEU|nr:phenylacetate--CoA ligase family protein [Allosaccharopolyspora coralli]QGK70106.1 phenylacetate--CoA ligase family protein [Allosaccharopolyspora coralli]